MGAARTSYAGWLSRLSSCEKRWLEQYRPEGRRDPYFNEELSDFRFEREDDHFAAIQTYQVVAVFEEEAGHIAADVERGYLWFHVGARPIENKFRLPEYDVHEFSRAVLVFGRNLRVGLAQQAVHEFKKSVLREGENHGIRKRFRGHLHKPRDIAQEFVLVVLLQKDVATAALNFRLNIEGSKRCVYECLDELLARNVGLFGREIVQRGQEFRNDQKGAESRTLQLCPQFLINIDQSDFLSRGLELLVEKVDGLDNIVGHLENSGTVQGRVFRITQDFIDDRFEGFGSVRLETAQEFDNLIMFSLDRAKTGMRDCCVVGHALHGVLLPLLPAFAAFSEFSRYSRRKTIISFLSCAIANE